MSTAAYGLLTLADLPKYPDLLQGVLGDSLTFKDSPHMIKRVSPTACVSGHCVLGGTSVSPELYVSARNERIISTRVGEVDHSHKEDYAIRLLLSLNSEPNRLKLPDLVYSRLYCSVPGQFFITFSQSSDHSRLIFLIRNVAVYFLGVVSDTEHYLVWSNEARFENSLKERYGNRYFYYRLPVVHSGCLVLQSQFLVTRYARWVSTVPDKLKVMSALENHLFKSHRIDPDISTL